MDGQMITIAGLWERKTKDGRTYLGGKLGTARLLLLPNQYKQKDTDPDYLLLVADKPKQQQDAKETMLEQGMPWED